MATMNKGRKPIKKYFTPYNLDSITNKIYFKTKQNKN